MMTLSMSNGEIAVEMFYSSSVVKSVETFDAAATGILDCDMTGGGYQTGKNPRSNSLVTCWVVIKTHTSRWLGCYTVAVVTL